LTFEHYLTSTKFGALPGAPLLTDRVSKVSRWPMYLNNQIGNCTAAAMLHSVAALTAFSGRVPGGAMFANATAELIYEKTGGYVPGDPSTDNGATLQSVCRYMSTIGAKDNYGGQHKLAAWANVGDPTNLSLLKKILNTFGTVYCAFNVDAAAETQFSAEQPWTPVPGSPNIGGHCIPLQLSAVGDPGYLYNETFITWGAEQKASRDWVRAQITEAVVLVSPDWLTAGGTTIEGLDLNALLADMRYV
jgi:hypothetical protein